MQGHVNPSASSTLWCGEMSVHPIPLHVDKAPLKVDVAPLQGDCFSDPESGTGEEEYERVGGGKVLPTRSKKRGKFCPCQEINLLLLRALLLSCGAHDPDAGVAVEMSVFNRMVEHLGERTELRDRPALSFSYMNRLSCSLVMALMSMSPRKGSQ